LFFVDFLAKIIGQYAWMCRAGGTEIPHAAVTLLQRKSEKCAHGYAVKQLVADVPVRFRFSS
jgi:hypothetical protein